MTGSWRRRPLLLVVLGISLSSAWIHSATRSALGAANGHRPMASGSWEANSAQLLVDYFHRLLDDRDFEVFRDRVTAQYTEDMLCRILSDSPAVTARRAAVVSLGFAGGFARSNAALGRALRDGDVTVR